MLSRNAFGGRVSSLHSLRTRLLLYFIPLAVVPLAVVGFMAYAQARAALEHAAEDKLAGMVAIKKRQIESYLAERQSSAHAAVDLVESLRRQAFDRLAALRDAQRSAVAQMYEVWKADVQDAATNSEVMDGAEELSAGPGATRHANGAGGDGKDARGSGEAEARLRGYLSQFAKAHGYRDAFLLDSQGAVMFRLGDRPARESGLQAPQRRPASARPTQPALAETVGPDGGAAVFMSAPLSAGSARLGFLALEIPMDLIESVVRGASKPGWGGLSYLVGRDGRLRARLSGLSTAHGALPLPAAPEPGAVVDTKASRTAAASLSGVDLGVGLRGTHCVSAYSPLGLPGLDWVIVVEEEITDALLPQSEGTGMYFLTHFIQRYGFEDLLLVEGDGYVFHTVMRAPDYQTNLLTGPYADTSLGHLVRKVLATGEDGIADFAPYTPAGSKPVAFVAAPLLYEENVLMAVVLQLPPGWIDGVMQERTGMGKTGETLLVGPDLRLRSNSSLDPTEHSIEASFVGTVERNGMDGEAVQAALAGETGTGVSFDTDYRGRDVIIAHAPVRFGTLTWALIAKQDVSEAFALVNRLTFVLVLAVNVAAALAVAVALWAAGRLVRPVLRLASAAEAVAGGDMSIDPQVPATRRDELGILARAFHSMTVQLRSLILGLEQRVDERTAQLQAANRELESFTYSVSHDLRAPLRAIDGYAQIMVDEYHAKLDDEGRRVLGIMRGEAKRMGDLIDDLLRFSRLGRHPLQKRATDMTRLVAEVLADLAQGAAERRVELRVDSLPGVKADPGLIRQVWMNLLGNAYKFTSGKDHAVIEVSGCIQGEEAVYCIRDNGAGFDMEHVDKLFGVFQRLHRQDEFEGTGVGLALAHRILERHGGRIWAEAEVGHGAIFRFALPTEGGSSDE
jgi:methyl-accepting chemotaxis protein